MNNNLLLFTLCIIPALILMIYVYINDKVEKEPLFLLILLFIGGIVSSVISYSVALILKMKFPFLNFHYSDMNIFQLIFKLFIIIAVVEELSKWLINMICTWKNKNFNYIFDPIVYSVFISLGFASFENLLYGFNYSSYGFVMVFLRGIISVPCHAVFGVFMGCFIGIAKKFQIKKKNTMMIKYIILSIMVPIILHFIYDLLLVNLNKITLAVFIIYVLLLYCFAYLNIEKFNSNKTLVQKKDI